MFRRSLTIAVIAGIPVRIHWTFLILLAWVFGSTLFAGGTIESAFASLVFVLAVFACVVAHEFGHIFAARAFGVRTRDVTLLPIGGVASLERMPDKPWQELVVAIAGPLVNVVIALLILPFLLWQNRLDAVAGIEQPANFFHDFLASLAAINVWLLVFNLLPAFPMDGGRILRSLLAMFMDHLRATRIAAGVGQVLAVGMALVGIFAGVPLLLIVALFVFLGAGMEASGAQARDLLRNIPVASVMLREFRVLSENHTLQDAVDELLANSQQDFPVTPDGLTESPVTGVLTRDDLVRALSQLGPMAPVRAAMSPACPPVSELDAAERCYDDLRSGKCALIPVVRGSRLVGLLNVDNIAEALLVRSAMHRRRINVPRMSSPPHAA